MCQSNLADDAYAAPFSRGREAIIRREVQSLPVHSHVMFYV